LLERVVSARLENEWVIPILREEILTGSDIGTSSGSDQIEESLTIHTDGFWA
jgi:hypothetical protein